MKRTKYASRNIREGYLLIAPLLAEHVRELILADIRYISPALLGELISFEGRDVLFLYSESVLNNSETLK